MLHSNAAKNLQLHQALYNKTIDTVKETNLPFIIIDEANQHGKNFAEKFCNAIEYCFGNGYSNVITIGSDCPNLSAKEIIVSSKNVEHNITTIGADNNGGFYLLALNRKNYLRNAFLNFNWCSSQLFKNIATYFNSTLSTLILLQNKQDVNNANNLSSLLKTLSTQFTKLLHRLFIISNKKYHLKLYLPKYFFYTTFSLRGPPAVTPF